MTRQELDKLEDLFSKKFHETELWKEFCQTLGIERISKILHICIDAEPEEIRIPDPTGMYLRIPKEIAKKILVLGL